MIVSFKDESTEAVFDGRDTKKARQACPQGIWRVARRKLDQINQASDLDDLRVPPGNRLEPLKGGQRRPTQREDQRPVPGVSYVDRRRGRGGRDS